MGLMFIFPVSENENDRISKNQGQITLKTYGLPMIFWGYLLASLSIIFIMFIAIRNPLKKLIQTGDSLNIILGQTVLATLILLPITLLFFYFYEKWISKSGKQITVKYRLFWLPLFKKTYTLKSPEALEVRHFLDSPNVAKQKSDPNLRGFQNRGYYELIMIDHDGKKRFLDRHPRKADLEKMKTLLSEY